MTFKTFKSELQELERIGALEKAEPSFCFDRLLFAYYATDEGIVTQNVDDDFEKLSIHFEDRLPSLLEEVGQFNLVEKLVPEIWAELEGMNDE